jgi:hypothetical protein
MRRLVLGVVAALLCACGGSDSSNTSSGNTDGLDVTGTWTATWTSRDGQVGQGTMVLAQSASGITGTVVVQGSPCLANGDVSGSLAGDELTGRMTAGGASVTFDTTVAASQMSGTYDAVVAGACTGDTGTFIATR